MVQKSNKHSVHDTYSRLRQELNEEIEDEIDAEESKSKSDVPFWGICLFQDSNGNYVL